MNKHGMILVLFFAFLQILSLVECDQKYCPGDLCRNQVSLNKVVLQIEQSKQKFGKALTLPKLGRSFRNNNPYEDMCSYCSAGSTYITKKQFEEYEQWWKDWANKIARNITEDLGEAHFFFNIRVIKFIRKDTRKELLYYVNLIRAC